MVASLVVWFGWFLAVPLNQIEATASKYAKETLRHRLVWRLTQTLYGLPKAVPSS